MVNAAIHFSVAGEEHCLCQISFIATAHSYTTILDYITHRCLFSLQYYCYFEFYNSLHHTKGFLIYNIRYKIVFMIFITDNLM